MEVLTPIRMHTMHMAYSCGQLSKFQLSTSPVLPSYPKEDQSIQSTTKQLQDKLQIIDHKQLEDQSIMKIAAVLFIYSMCYIASTEQAAAPPGIYTYPSRPWKEMEHKTQQRMEEFKMKAKVFSENAKAAQIPTDPEELRQCANMDCPGSKK